MINLNDYYLHPLKGKYVTPGIQLLHYWPEVGNPTTLLPHVVTVSKVRKFFGAVVEYEYTDDSGGTGWCGGGIDVVIQVVPLKELCTCS